MSACNPHNLVDGDLMTCVGGPWDGVLRKVTVIFPFLDGGLPSSMLSTGTGHWYELDAANRRWVYKGKEYADAGIQRMT